MKAKSLADLIFRHYLRSALVPVLTVELLLVSAYFLVNAWNNRETELALRREVQQILPHLASREAAQLQDGFARIARETNLFAKEHEALVADPARFTVRGEIPILAKSPNGTLHQPNRQTGSSLFYAKNAVVGPAQREIAIKTAALDPLYKHMVDDVPNVVATYYNTSDNMNRLYPYIKNVWEQYPADLTMSDYNFFYLADAKHNPSRKPVWTGAYLDPAGQGWMVSCVAPVFLRDSLHGVVGLDVTIDRIVKNLLGQELPWSASAFLVDDSGMILAMPAPVEELFGLKELKQHIYESAVKTEQHKPSEFNLLANPDRALAARFRSILDSGTGLVSIEISGRESFLVQERIPETGWRLFVVAQSTEVFRTVEQVASGARLVGGAVVAGMLLFYLLFFAYLRRNARVMSSEISLPITNLSQATSELGKTEFDDGADLAMSGIPEIDRLTTNFNTMSKELRERSDALVRSAVREQLKEKEAELSFARGQFESASGYLHNVGNLTVRLSSSAMDLQEIVATTDQYPEVFRRIRSPDGGAILDKFEDVLLGKVVPKLKECTREIAEIRTSIHNAIEHQQREFVDGMEAPDATEFDLSEIVMSVCADFSKWADGSRIEFATRIESGVRIRGHRHQMKAGILNGVKNAFEAVGAGPGKIEVSMLRDAGTLRTRLTISDTGHGVAHEDRSRLLSAGFTTKPWGHGLGLHSLAVFLASRNGSVKLESEGRGKGAILVIEVADA